MEVWSIGHSNHSVEHFLSLLTQHGIGAIADVRSQPHSAYSPHFSREPLCLALGYAGIHYVFLGDELGGRPKDTSLYDAEGHVLYGELAQTELFRVGLDRLIEGAADYRIAVLCSEGDPTNCHRHLLVARVLRDLGVVVHHIMGDGSICSEEELARPSTGDQATLFGKDASNWRSTQSVLRSGRRKASSSP